MLSYSVAAWIYPLRYRRPIGYITGWLNLLGQVAGVASLLHGLARCNLAAIVVSRSGDFSITPARLFGAHAAVGVAAGLVNSFSTKGLARVTWLFLAVNLAAFLAIVTSLLASTPNQHPLAYSFGECVASRLCSARLDRLLTG